MRGPSVWLSVACTCCRGTFGWLRAAPAMDQSAALPAEMIAAETAGDNPKIVNDPASGASW